VNFASDNWSGALPSVMDAVVRHNCGFAAAYGSDALTASVTRTFAEIFEREVDVHFVATGTAANSLSMAAVARTSGLVFCSADAHLHNDEYGATEFLTGMKLATIPAIAGKLDPAGLAAALEATPDGRLSGPATVLTLTNATECGTTYTPDEVGALAALARARGMAVHIDGARFANAVAATGASPADLTWRAGADLMSFGGTKNGCLGAEAIVVFNRDIAPDIRLIRYRAGHVMSKARFIASQYEGYFADGAWLTAAAHANAMAARLTASLQRRTDVRLPWTSTANEVFPVIPRATFARLQQAGAVFYDWPLAGLGPSEICVRLVTSFATTEADVDRFLSLL
jgi:threonine aldolase